MSTNAHVSGIKKKYMISQRLFRKIPPRFFRDISTVMSENMASCLKHNFYDKTPIQLGVEVRGIDLKSDISDDVIAAIKSDVTEHRLVVFRDQGIISGKRHVEISRWFGEPESTFYKHPRSPDPDVFRVSNDDQEGCTGVGRTGWHIDGSFQPAPFAYSLYHIINVPDQGDTGIVIHFNICIPLLE